MPAVRAWWDRLSKLPFGKRLFSYLIGWLVPYSGTVGVRVQELGEGHSTILLPDRRRVRNHLSSIHAIALMNVGEIAGGLPMIYTLPPGGRAILTGIKMEYLKKARGPITATCRFTLPKPIKKETLHLESLLKDASGVLVAKAHAEWLVDPGSRKES